MVNLLELFERINMTHFDGFLDRPELKWNSRLRSSAGRFVPGSRRFLALRDSEPRIEIASYLLEESNALALVADTIAHEMIHYWLWVRRRPYGHTSEFMAKMRQMGVSRYNTVPRLRPPRYAYRCPACESEFLARRKLGILACAKCCKKHSNGRYDARFKLFLHRRLDVSPEA
jgi:predicted SprT family Zn-dependent metalloprotease